MKNNLILLFIILLIHLNINLNGQIIRGTAPGEIYVHCLWYLSYPDNYQGVFHSWDNGISLSPQTKFQEGYQFFGDSLPGNVYLRGFDTIKRSQDYGVSWTSIYSPIVPYEKYASGCKIGEIYKQANNGNPFDDLMRSDDFGVTFQTVYQSMSYILLDVGPIPGEVYAYQSDSNRDTLQLKYSTDFGHSFTSIIIDTSILNPQGFAPVVPILSRGTESGEFYLIMMDTTIRYRVFHTANNGSSFEYNYITEPCDLCYGQPLLLSFTAGREPGSFYIMRAILDSITQDHYILCIDYSQDYGKTYVTHCFDLDSTFTGIGDIPAIAKNDLKQNYPNPFHDQTQIGFYLDKPAFTWIKVYDVRGNQLATLASGRFSSGMHQVTWDGRNDAGRKLPAGIYYYRLTIDGVPSGARKAVIF